MTVTVRVLVRPRRFDKRIPLHLASPASAIDKMSSDSNTPQRKVDLYTSLVAGSVFVTKHTESIQTMFAALKVPYNTIDVSLDEKGKAYLHSNSKAANPRGLPQVFVDGVYLGDYSAIEMLNEDGELKDKVK